MPLEDIGEMLAGPAGAGRWRQVVEEQMESLTAQIERMEAAKAFLEHVVSYHDYAPDGCPHYETLIWEGTRSTHH